MRLGGLIKIFLKDELEVYEAYKRMVIIGLLLWLPWAIIFLTYFWLSFSTIFSIPLGFLLFFKTPSEYSNIFGLYWFLEVNTFTVRITHLYERIVLFRVNTTTEITLLLLIYALALPLIILGVYNFILLRLSKEAEYGRLLFTLRTWKLPPSNRYKTYGEAKKRIREIFRNGTPKEKHAIHALIAAQLLLFPVIIMFTLWLANILPFPITIFHINITLLAVLLLILGMQRTVWKTIT
ncbi:MAG: hypothetical protein QXS27_00285 [Candidatus Jordarchaeaceae archaeon]